MPDILKVTTPLTGQENTGRLRPNISPPQIPNIPDPTRVTRPNQQNVYSERQPSQELPNFESNFERFLQLIRNAPMLADSWRQLVFSELRNIISSGIEADFAREISDFLQLMEMSPQELLAFVKGQADSSSKFNGQLFDALRQALAQKPSADLEKSVLTFVRAFDNATSANHVLSTMMSNLRNISSTMTMQNRNTLLSLVEKLDTTPMSESNVHNLNILKNEIMPFLSKYVSITRDFGSARDIMSLLSTSIAKYENGTKDSLLAAFRRMFSYSELSSKLDSLGVKDLESFMAKALNSQKGSDAVDKFMGILSKGINGQAGYAQKAIFENIMESTLINKSVYMPVQHIIVPGNIDGKMFFSEMWIDPDEENTYGTATPPTAKLLVKFDIKDLGFFELLLLCKDNRVHMQLRVPEAVSDKGTDIRKTLGEIMTSNKLIVESLSLDKSLIPLVVSDVFPKLYERKDTINVTV